MEMILTQRWLNKYHCLVHTRFYQLLPRKEYLITKTDIYNCAVNGRFQRISRQALIHLHINRCALLQPPAASSARGGVERKRPFPTQFLVRNRPGACQSPRTCRRSLSGRGGPWGWEPSLTQGTSGAGGAHVAEFGQWIQANCEQ